MADRDGAAGRRNRLLRAVGILALAGVAIGLSIGLLGASLLNALGISATDEPSGATRAGRAQHATPSPTSAPTAKPTASSSPTKPSPTAKPTASSSPTKPSPTAKPDRPKRQRGFLQVTPAMAAPGARINLTGALDRVPVGTSLQVQRLEGGQWTDFPVHVLTQEGGTFSIYIETSRTGSMWFRLTDGSGHATPRARVRVG